LSIAAIAANVAIAITKFIAATLSGSSALFSEGLHSMVDTGDGLLLLLGLHLARKPATRRHPYGHNGEIYFWSMIVAMSIFGMGGGLSIYEGILHLLEQRLPSAPIWTYSTLGAAFVFEGVSWLISVRGFRRTIGARGMWDAIRASKDPTSFAVLFEDSAALIGIIIAFAGTLAAHLLAMPVLDGVASIGIGVILAATAIFLARESKALLIGEGARGRTNRSIRQIAAQCNGVEQVNDLVTVHLAPDQVVVAISLEFKDELTTPEIERAVAAIEKQICEKHPEVFSVFIKPQSSMTRGQRNPGTAMAT